MKWKKQEVEGIIENIKHKKPLKKSETVANLKPIKPKSRKVTGSDYSKNAT